MADILTLDGRTAIVTGAGNGLGRAEAIALARAGARLVLNDLPGPAVHAVAGEITAAGGQAVVSEGDVGEWSTGESLLAAALDAYGGLDILVNNAGVLRDRMIFTMSAEEWDLVLRVHLRGHFITTRLATAYWREASKRVLRTPLVERLDRAGRVSGLVRSARSAAAFHGVSGLTWPELIHQGRAMRRGTELTWGQVLMAATRRCCCGRRWWTAGRISG